MTRQLIGLLCALALVLTACPAPVQPQTDATWDASNWDAATWK